MTTTLTTPETIAFTERLRLKPDEHLLALYQELANPCNPCPMLATMASDMCRDESVRIGNHEPVVSGFPKALEKVERIVLMEAGRRWMKLREALREES